MSALQDALQSALAVAGDCDPRDMDAAELAMLDALDARAFEIMDLLIARHDECGHAARAAIARAMRR